MEKVTETKFKGSSESSCSNEEEEKEAKEERKARCNMQMHSWTRSHMQSCHFVTLLSDTEIREDVKRTCTAYLFYH